MDTLNSSISKQRRSPSPNKSIDLQPQIKKSKVLNESELDSMMKHWEEYRVQGIKIPRRSYHSACSHGNILYVYGGYDINAGILSDFLKVDLHDEQSFQWENIPLADDTKPGPRCRHTTIVYQDKIYLYGGQINSVQNTNQLFVFDIKENKWSLIESNHHEHFPLVDSHCAVLWDKGEGKSSMIIVGGFLGGKDGGYSNAVYEYNFEENKMHTLFKNQEVELAGDETPSIPPGRMGLGAAIYQNTLYIFGGNEGNTKMNDLWKFDLNEKKWSFVKPEGQIVPEPRNGHTLVCYKSILILFGGILDITHEKNDIFVFNLKNNTWLAIEKDTKWVFEDTIKLSPHKKSHLASPGSDQGKNKLKASPLKRRTEESDNESPKSSGTKGKSNFEGMGTSSRSPRKYEKLKLLETLPKGVYSSKDASLGEDDISASKMKGASQFQTNLEEKATKEKLLRKMILLKEFEVDETKEKDDEFKLVTPALEAMQKSIESLGLNAQVKERNENVLSNSFNGADPIKNVDDGKPIKVGVKPLARDGHSATIQGDRMFIFAGDRHKMSFNDLFALNLKYFDNKNL